MRNHFAEEFYQLGADNDKLAIVVADISPAGPIARFHQEFPDRFINTGVAEQAMIGIAAGMALRGMRPFAYTIATFALYRPFEFVRNDICYQNLPVTIVGIGGGVIYSTLGATHHAMEDIAIASAIPGMTVIAPSDPLEVVEATRWCANISTGPVYLRLGKAGEPDLTSKAISPFKVGKLRYLQDGEDYCVISYGVCMRMAKDVASQIELKFNKPVALVACHTLKPLDKSGITQLLHKYKNVIVLEEHVPNGSLSMQIKNIAWDCQATCKLHCHTLQDKFIHTYGSHQELLQAHSLTVENVVELV